MPLRTSLLIFVYAVIDASLGEILTTAAKLEWLMDHGETYLQPDSRHSNLLTIYKKSQVVYEPLGVIAGIVSWNYRKTSFESEFQLWTHSCSQLCIMHGLLSLLVFSLEMLSSSSAPSKSFGLRTGSLASSTVVSKPADTIPTLSKSCAVIRKRLEPLQNLPASNTSRS